MRKRLSAFSGVPSISPMRTGRWMPLAAGRIIGFNSHVRRLTGGTGVEFIAILSNYHTPEGVQLGAVWSEIVCQADRGHHQWSRV
jgi:hypothetical protein